MKTHFWFSILALGFFVGCATAPSASGPKASVAADNHLSSYPIISVPYTGPVPEGRAIVVDKASGKSYPATLLDGQVVFIPDQFAPSAKVAFTLQAAKNASTPPKVQITQKEGDKLDVVIDGQPFTTYYYSKDNKKPFLWPLLAEGGVTVTRDWPMGPKKETSDHPHHKSFWTAFGDVNGADCWAEGENSGFQISQEVTFGSGDAVGWIKAKNQWQNKDHKPVVMETRLYRFYATPAGQRTFDVRVTFSADYGEVRFGDTKEGGIVAFRVNDAIREPLTPKKTGDNVGGKGKITISTGDPKPWGKRAAWSDYSGPLEGAGVRGIAVFDTESNLRFPTPWHIRDYGLNGANPFGLAAFTEGKEHGEYTVKSGEALTFNYRVIVHSGDVNEAKIADRYADYAKPPIVTWAK